MTLQFADDKPKEHYAFLLFGREGDGKSTAAASAPGPIVYANADRPGAIRFARRLYPAKEFLELPVDSKATLEELYLWLRDGKLDQAQTVVLDSLGRIYKIALAAISNNAKQPTWQHRNDVNMFMSRYVYALTELPFHVVLVAHDLPIVTSGKEEDGSADIELFPFCGVNNPTLAKELMQLVDVVAWCGWREIDTDGKRRRQWVAQLYAAGGRRAKETTGALDAEPGDVEPLDLTDWIGRIHKFYGVGDVADAKAETKTKKDKEAVAA